MKHKSGFVNIIGNPNAGKSTLLNQLMGEKLAIVTQKVQTTRHRIFGIYNEEDLQIVFSDTPGILKPHYKLQQKMMDFVEEAFQDADVILFITEVNDFHQENQEILDKIGRLKIPIFILVNKIDKSNQSELEKNVAFWNEKFPNALILPISALNGVNIVFIFEKLRELLPECPPYFDKEQFTDKPERFFVNETIREKILLNYEKEIPYSVEVVTESFNEGEENIIIDSVIYVERDSQKGIIIGHKGSSLSKVGKQARRDLQNFFKKKIQLNLFVKVQKNWRKNDKDLNRFGYSK
ncbi:MAG: GTPase Era [Flavobacteriales bacterium]|nr:GTPase Era [Flavobacteriales bacterium]